MNPKQLTIDDVQEILLKEEYVCDRSLATVVYLSLATGKPLLLEGEAGVGKTEIAKVLAKVLNAKLIRLQCYEGLDANTALYEWNYPKQMLRIKLEEVQRGDKKAVETHSALFDPKRTALTGARATTKISERVAPRTQTPSGWRSVL